MDALNVLARSEVGNATVTTVFVTIGERTVYDTRVFGSRHGGYSTHCDSCEDAEAAHDETVQMIEQHGQ